MLQFAPSLVAATALYLARRMLLGVKAADGAGNPAAPDPAWTNVLAYCTLYTKAQLLRCAHVMVQALADETYHYSRLHAHGLLLEPGVTTDLARMTLERLRSVIGCPVDAYKTATADAIDAEAAAQDIRYRNALPDILLRGAQHIAAQMPRKYVTTVEGFRVTNVATGSPPLAHSSPSSPVLTYGGDNDWSYIDHVDDFDDENNESDDEEEEDHELDTKATGVMFVIDASASAATEASEPQSLCDEMHKMDLSNDSCTIAASPKRTSARLPRIVPKNTSSPRPNRLSEDAARLPQLGSPQQQELSASSEHNRSAPVLLSLPPKLQIKFKLYPLSPTSSHKQLLQQCDSPRHMSLVDASIANVNKIYIFESVKIRHGYEVYNKLVACPPNHSSSATAEFIQAHYP